MNSKNTLASTFIAITLQIVLSVNVRAGSGIFDRSVIIQTNTLSFFSGSQFNGYDFGEMTGSSVFIIKGGQLKTYKNGIDDITGAAIYYRIYEQGVLVLPDFDTINLPWKEDVQSPLGSIDQTWEQAGITVNLLNGLPDGDFYLEVYFEAFYTNGSGPLIHIDNNTGSNYKASFSINNCKLDLGPDLHFCSSFDVLLNAGASNTSYLWSTGDTTNVLNTTQAGTYIVTITNPTCTATDTIVISQGTSSFSLNIGNDTTVCGLGIVSLNTGGGFTEYTWSTGDTATFIQVNTAGIYTVTVSTTDNCLLTDACEISFNGLPVVDIGTDVSLCSGDSVVLDAGPGFNTYLWSDNTTDQQLVTFSSGIYAVTVTDSSGCSGFDIVQVSAYSTPVADFSYAQGLGLTIDFTDLSAHSTQNFWDFTGSGSYTPHNPGNISFTFPFTGAYTVSLISSNTCSSDTIFKSINVSTDINEYKLAGNIIIFPIPSTGDFDIQLPSNEVLEHISLTNITGQTVELKQIGTQTKENLLNFAITNSKDGIYFLQITTSAASYTKSIIIKKR